ncbi:MAG: (d)CMP kinase [Verrucomicrobia bacterium]|nr:(d)CMP kinase [Cytophagales bacterium]
MKKIIIAIDGYSGCGKSTTAKIVATRLGYIYIDTGAMYRAVTLYFIRNNTSFIESEAIEKALHDIQIDFVRNAQTGKNETHLNKENVEAEIRKMYVAEKVSEVSAIGAVRRAMVAQQQRMAKKKGVVMDGRDIGTVVFPAAELKVFMNADLKIRAYRRKLELLEKGDDVDITEIMDNLRKRDQIDTTRVESPLRQAEDAFYLDTTHLTADEQSDFVINLAIRTKIEVTKKEE